MNFKALIAAGALLATQSFAIVGLGFHYAPGLGTKMNGMPAPANVAPGVDFQHEGFDGLMQGFGFKLWVDLLPVIDIEATLNVQFGSYDATLYVDGADPLPLEIELAGTPFAKANPKFVAMTGDLSITYPITTLPIIRPYIGGGLSYHMNSFILNQKFMTGLMQKETVHSIITGDAVTEAAEAVAMGMTPEQYANEKAKKLKQEVQDYAIKEGLNTSIGGHILVGLRAKLPIIPIAAYSNFKYYIGGDYPDEIDAGNMTVEVGVGLAI